MKLKRKHFIIGVSIASVASIATVAFIFRKEIAGYINSDCCVAAKSDNWPWS